MAICRKCKRVLIGWGYTVHHGNYHYECLMEKYPDAVGEKGNPHIILMGKVRQ